MYLPLHLDTSILIPSVLLPRGAKKATAASKASEASAASEAGEASKPVSQPVAAYVPTFSFTSLTPTKTAPAATLPGHASKDIPTTTFSFPVMTESTPQPAPAAKAEDLTLKAPGEPVEKWEEPVQEPEEYVAKWELSEEEPEERVAVPPPGQRKSK